MSHSLTLCDVMKRIFIRLLLLSFVLIPQWAQAEVRTGYLLDLDGPLTPATMTFVRDTYTNAIEKKVSVLILRIGNIQASPHVLEGIGTVLEQSQLPVISYVLTTQTATADMQAILERTHLVTFQHQSAAQLEEGECCIAGTLSDLLLQLDGQQITVQEQIYTFLHADIALQEVHPSWRYQTISIVTAPNMIFLLIVIAIHAFLFEWARPGNIRAATIGSVSLLLSFVAMQYHSINYWALLGLIGAVGMLLFELQRMKNGFWGIAGTVLFFVAGSALISTPNHAYQVSIEFIIIGFILISAMLLLTVCGQFNRKYR